MFQPTENKLVIKVASKHVKAITNIVKLSALQNNTTIDPADFVNITGEVVALPKRITNDIEHEGFSLQDIYEGDLAIFSYQVIYDILYKAATDKFEYRNMVTYKGEEYFLADITKVFGVVRGGDIIMVNGWVMLSEYPAGVIVMQQSSKKIRGTTRSEIMHIGKAKTNQTCIQAKQGETALFSPYKPQHYKINEKPFIILKQSQILGIL